MEILNKEEFLVKSEQANQFLHNLFDKKDTERLIALQLWQCLNLEKILKPAFTDCEFKRKKIGIELYGEIILNNKIIGRYNNQPWPQVVISTFCPGKGKRTDLLVNDKAIQLIKGVHRILDWHRLIKNNCVQVLLDNTWVINFIPSIPNIDELDELLTNLKSGNVTK